MRRLRSPLLRTLFAMHNLPEKVRVDKEEFESRYRSVQQSLRDLAPLLVTEEGKRLRSEIETELPKYHGYFENVLAAATAGNHPDALREYTEHSFGSLQAMEKSTVDIIAIQQRIMAQSNKDAA